MASMTRFYHSIAGAVDLSRLNAGAPLLDTHQDGAAANIVGKIIEGSAKIEDGRGTATVLLSRASDVADIVQKLLRVRRAT